ncbi:MAG: hypothetical protein MPJ22_06575 [Pirellulales bacterium]|nr:hypothetical protein [Pirellulales bacterium]
MTQVPVCAASPLSDPVFPRRSARLPYPPEVPVVGDNRRGERQRVGGDHEIVLHSVEAGVRKFPEERLFQSAEFLIALAVPFQHVVAEASAERVRERAEFFSFRRFFIDAAVYQLVVCDAGHAGFMSFAHPVPHNFRDGRPVLTQEVDADIRVEHVDHSGSPRQ